MATPDKRKRHVNIAVSNMEKRLEEQKKEFAQSCSNIVAQIEEDDRQEKIELHNRFAAIIEEMQPSSENILYILRLIEHEVLDMVVAKMGRKKE